MNLDNIKKNTRKKLKKYKTRQKGSDTALKIFVAIFIIGYSFFFLSPYFFPKVYKNLDIINSGKIIDMKEHIFSLCTWDYSREDNMFEIIFTAQNLTLNDKPKYEFIAKSGDDVYKSKLVKNIDGKLIVVRVYDIPKRWTEITLSMSADDNQTYINMNDKVVSRVSHIKNRTSYEYKVYALEKSIKGLDNNIINRKKDIENLAKKSTKAYKKLEELRQNENQLGTKEREINDNNKSKIATEIGKYKATMDSYNVEIDENRKKIEDIKRQLEKLKGKNKK